MPIISETMLRILDTANRAVEKVDLTRKRFDEILRDSEIAKSSLIHDPQITEDRLQTIINTSRDAIRELFLPLEDIRFLAGEFERFKINQSKNAASRERMKLYREGTRVIDHFSPRPNRRPNRAVTAMNELNDLAFFTTEGQKHHPQEGRCDGEPCRICERLAVGAFAKPGGNTDPHADGFEDSDPFAPPQTPPNIDSQG